MLYVCVHVNYMLLVSVLAAVIFMSLFKVIRGGKELGVKHGTCQWRRDAGDPGLESGWDITD